MFCGSCGATLAPNESNCHNCGSPTPYYYAQSGSTPYEATTVVPTQQQTPSAGPEQRYNSQYAAPSQNAYGSPSPSTFHQPQAQQAFDGYAANGIPPVSQPPGKNGSKVGVIVGVIILIAILIGGSVVALIIKNNSVGTATNIQGTQTASAATTVHNQATATAITGITATAKVDMTATTTARASQNPYPPNTGTLIINDPLTDNSKGYQWDEATYPGAGACAFSNGAYHITTLKAGGIICIPEAKSLEVNNFAFEVKITVVQGDNGGVTFHINQSSGTFYYFEVYTNGKYILEVYTSKYTTLLQGNSAAIKLGLNQTNLLAVVANGNNIVLYVNNQTVSSISDSTLKGGQVGVASFYDNGQSNIIVSDARMWQLA